jgi:hypothetical protein
MSSSDENKPRLVECIVEEGRKRLTEVAGAGGGALVGLALGGPPGAIIGAIAGPTLTGMFNIASDFAMRKLTKKERERVAIVLALVDAKIAQRQANGDRIRDDGFFVTDPIESGGEQIGEAVLVAAQRDPQQKKLEYYASLLANLAFTTSVDRPEAYMLTKVAEELSYRQLCMIGIFARRDFHLRDAFYVNFSHMTEKLASVLKELYDLWTAQLVVAEGWNFSNALQLIPARLSVYGVGGLLFNLMELDHIPVADLDEVAQFLC